MTKSTQIERYRRALAKELGVNSSHITLFGKGRQGLYALLRSLGIGAGDEVMVPAFTCVVVPNAILYTGATPVYVDIDARTFNLTVEHIAGKITPATKAIIVQNTFGLSPDFDPILQFARSRGLFVIEDCAHGFGGQYKGKPNGTLGDAAFFSTQWNKPFSTGLGGFVYVKSPDLAKAMQEKEQKLTPPSRLFEYALRAQIFARRYLLRPFIYWPVLKLYRKLSAWSIVSGSSESEELTGTRKPANYLRAFGKVQAKEGVRALAKFKAIKRKRERIATFYDELFVRLNLPRPYIPPYACHGWLRYPFLVKDRDRFLQLAEKARIPIGDWMRSPLHPVAEGWERWGYAYGENPTGEYLSSHVLNLLTDPDVTDQQLKNTAAFLEKHRDELLFPDFYEACNNDRSKVPLSPSLINMRRKKLRRALLDRQKARRCSGSPTVEKDAIW